MTGPSTPTAVDVEGFAFHQSSPHSLPQPSVVSSSPATPSADIERSSRDCGLAAADLLDGVASLEHGFPEDEDRRTSIFSSISSIPPSVIHHDGQDEDQTTPSRPPLLRHHRHDSMGSHGSNSPSRKGRGYASAFRNPSSVRAMQMRDDDVESIAIHRRSASRMSTHSHGSAYSTLTSPSRHLSRSSRSSPPKESKLRKEFPLVLLHCTLLSATNRWLDPSCDDELFSALLPEVYQKRWDLLRDRLADAEVRARGVLISHPQEDYDLLEERLLEALELENPRIHRDHFVDQGGADSGFESSSQTDGESDLGLAEDAQCPDCGKQLRPMERHRKWEVKVYAANGLMRAGAWSAAWREMEKVDVEVSLWMPDDVRREVSDRFEAVKASEQRHVEPEETTPAARRSPSQSEVHGEAGQATPAFSNPDIQQPHQSPSSPPCGLTSQASAGLAMSRVKAIFDDGKNVLILALSLLVLFYAMRNGAATAGQLQPPVVDPNVSLSNQGALQGDRLKLSMSEPNSAELPTTTVTSTKVWTTTYTAIDTAAGSPSAATSDSVSADSPISDLSAEAESQKGAQVHSPIPKEKNGQLHVDEEPGLQKT